MQGVYMIKIGKLKYIGSSTNIEKRIKNHHSTLGSGVCTSKLQKAFYTNGKKFQWEVLREVDRRSKLASYEGYFIGLYDTVNNGLNTTMAPSDIWEGYDEEELVAFTIKEAIFMRKILKFYISDYENHLKDMRFPLMDDNLKKMRALLKQIGGSYRGEKK